MSAVVITPTTGIPELRKALESTEGQDCEHWVVVDGPQYAQQVADIFNTAVFTNKKIILLPENVGKPAKHWSGKENVMFYGNRVYCAVANLVNADHILFLDEDNWFEPNHIETMVAMVNQREHEFAYGLRKCVTWDGQDLCNDDCDSLGFFASWKNFNLVDMNCYIFKTSFLLKINQTLQTDYYWTDRLLYRTAVAACKDYDNYGCTGLYTVNYRVKEAAKYFFLEGNQYMDKLYNGNFPWRAK